MSVKRISLAKSQAEPKTIAEVPAQKPPAQKEMPLALTWQQFNALRDYDRERVAMFVRILEDSHKGTSAPGEEYIANLVLQHSHERLTPEIASDALEQFEQNFEMAVGISREFIALYPETMRGHVETVYGRTPAGGGK